MQADDNLHTLPLTTLVATDLTLSEDCKRLLLMAQVKAALSGNSDMLKHLGTNFLDQSSGTSTIKVEQQPYEELSREQLLEQIKIKLPDLLLVSSQNAK